MMPQLTGDGMLVAGDAAALCLAAGIWLEGVNFAMASGIVAGEAAGEALAAGDTSAAGLAGYERRLAATFVLRDHRKLRRAPELVLSDRVQHLYPQLVAGGRRGDVPGRQPAAQAGAAPSPRARAQAPRHPSARPGRRRASTAGGRSGEALPGVANEWPDDAARSTCHRRRLAVGAAFDDLIGTTEFRVTGAHIVVDGAVCADCSTRECVVACPAKLFVPTADGGILFNYEQCFECGTCYMVCNREGAISWSYPEGGHGVVFRRS